ncbi:hypothetical protein [Streptomyces sp. NPDC056255]|uniref:hypothetical protein n=1 Tax=Streptomyces sp. NPDC056255 TaxID=3345764 RepID=UPI0035E23A86
MSQRSGLRNDLPAARSARRAYTAVVTRVNAELDGSPDWSPLPSRMEQPLRGVVVLDPSVCCRARAQSGQPRERGYACQVARSEFLNTRRQPKG